MMCDQLDQHEGVDMTDVVERGSVHDVAEELYSLLPRDFTRVRNTRARQARQAGDTDAKAAILGMAKPDAAAWMANQLVRQRRDQVDAVLALARPLRTQLIPVNPPQTSPTWIYRWALMDLGKEGMRLAERAGVRRTGASSEYLENTLRSATCTEEMTQLLLLARLSRSLPSVGWPGLIPDNMAEITAASGAGEPTSDSGGPDFSAFGGGARFTFGNVPWSPVLYAHRSSIGSPRWLAARARDPSAAGGARRTATGTKNPSASNGARWTPAGNGDPSASGGARRTATGTGDPAPGAPMDELARRRALRDASTPPGRASRTPSDGRLGSVTELLTHRS
jgi:hypothetical protein